jgi:hypothetical protein
MVRLRLDTDLDYTDYLEIGIGGKSIEGKVAYLKYMEYPKVVKKTIELAIKQAPSSLH